MGRNRMITLGEATMMGTDYDHLYYTRPRRLCQFHCLRSWPSSGIQTRGARRWQQARGRTDKEGYGS